MLETEEFVNRISRAKRASIASSKVARILKAEASWSRRFIDERIKLQTLTRHLKLIDYPGLAVVDDLADMRFALYINGTATEDAIKFLKHERAHLKTAQDYGLLTTPAIVYGRFKRRIDVVALCILIGFPEGMAEGWARMGLRRCLEAPGGDMSIFDRVSLPKSLAIHL